MEAYQRRLVWQIASQVDRYREGLIDRRALLANTWGLMTAASLEGSPAFADFYGHWAVIDGEHEMRTEPWALPEWTSDTRLDAAIAGLKAWAEEVGLDPLA
jgi:hypothetical protein